MRRRRLSKRVYWQRFWRYLLCDELWRIRVRKAGGAWENLPMRDVPCRRGFCADPFLVAGQGGLLCFYETLTPLGKGVLGCAEYAGGRWRQQGVVLEEAWHQSYPQVFRDGDRWLMIPESKANNGVSLYQADDFPYGWRRIGRLLEGPYADSTILRWEGKWYLFAYREEVVRQWLELWVADRPEGPWALHPQGACIQRSRRLSRPAGACMVEGDGRLFRVAQDCNGDYGKRVFRVPILELSPTRYREGRATLLVAKGDRGARGAHTYNKCVTPEGVFEVKDFKRFALKPAGRLMRDVWLRVLGFAAKRFGRGK